MKKRRKKKAALENESTETAGLSLGQNTQLNADKFWRLHRVSSAEPWWPKSVGVGPGWLEGTISYDAEGHATLADAERDKNAVF